MLYDIQIMQIWKNAVGFSLQFHWEQNLLKYLELSKAVVLLSVFIDSF